MRVMREKGQWRWQVWARIDSRPPRDQWYKFKTYRSEDREAAEHLAKVLVAQGYGVEIRDKAVTG